MKPTAKKTRARPPRRWPLLRFADLFAQFFAAPSRRDVVLLVRTFGIGDALLFRLLLDVYKAALVPEGMRCIILGATDWQPIVADFFAGETVILVDQKRYARRFFYRLRFNILLRQLGVARAVCPVYRRNPIVADAIVAATCAPERWVMEPEVAPKMRNIARFFRSGMTRIVDTDAHILPDDRHELQRQSAFIAALAPDAPLDLQRTRLFDLLSPLPADGRDNTVLINLGASYGPRRWPLARWLQVAVILSAAEHRIVMVGGAAERDLLFETEAWHSSLPTDLRDRIDVAVGDWSFAELIRRTRRAALVLSSDTGPAHLAALLDVPVIVVLGGGHFGEFFPYPQQPSWAHVRALWRSRDCYFCGWTCPHLSSKTQTYPCISDILVEDVVAAAHQVLSKCEITPPDRTTG